jgi:hypothetical protein
MQRTRILLQSSLAWLYLADTCAAAAAAIDQKLAQAAIVVQAFDRLDSDCRSHGQYTGDQQAQVETWESRNPVDAVRSRVPAMRADPTLARQFDQAIITILGAARSARADTCLAAASLVKLPDAQFPALALQPDSSVVAAPAARVTPDLLARIEGFGFATRPKMGMGGFITLDIHPVVLFKSGDLLLNVAALRDSRGIDALLAARPEDWTRWRREGGELQIRKQDQWEKLPFQTVYSRLPDGLRLEGLFRSLGGTGNLASGGSQSVTIVDEYRFAADGALTRSGAVGSRAESGNTSVATRAAPGVRHGRYRIEGLVLQIDYDDGLREQRLLIADPKDPSGGIWLDGEAYVRRR